MTDLSEVFDRIKKKELEDLEAEKMLSKPIEAIKLVVDEGRILFESKKDSCY